MTFLITFTKSYCHAFDYYARNISVFFYFIIVITIQIEMLVNLIKILLLFKIY